jgi:predicted AlkP superfamily pyrophosphatase or phosphodiesterase
MKTDWSRRQFVSALSLLLALSTFFSIPTSNAQQRRSATTARSSVKKPRLVVGIVIDQFRYNYLTRFEDQFGEGGFKRLLNGGAVFTNANYIHTPTYTACGHAMFMSGATPAMNGIVGNEWYDRESGNRVTSVSDDKPKLLGGREGATGMSPHRRGATLPLARMIDLAPSIAVLLKLKLPQPEGKPLKELLNSGVTR